MGEMKKAKNALLAMAKNFDLKLAAVHQAITDSHLEQAITNRLNDLSIAAAELHEAADEYVRVWKS